VKHLLRFILSALLILAYYPKYGVSAEEERELLRIEVSSGDTLSRFAQRYLDDPQKWPELLEYNEIPSGDPNLIIPGDVLYVPEDLVKEEIADIVHIRNNVRMRRQESHTWERAYLEERLFPEDGIRTSENSHAKIQYLTGGGASISENSLVFLRPEREREDVVDLEVGGIRARDVKVLTASAAIDPRDNSEYIAEVDEEQTTTLSVMRGSVDFISSGEMVTVDEGYMSRAELDKAPSEPRELPSPPDIEDFQIDGMELHRNGIVDTDEFLKNIGYGRAGDEISGIELQVAEDEEFSKIVLDKSIDRENPESWREELDDGIYWWRAAFKSGDAIRGNYSDPVKFEIRTRPPELIINSPHQGAEINRRVVSIYGRTDRGAAVTVDGVAAKVDEDGNFVAAAGVSYGNNEVVVKASDEFERTTEKTLNFKGNPEIEVEEDGNGQRTVIIIGVVSSIVSVAAIVISVMQ